MFSPSMKNLNGKRAAFATTPASGPHAHSQQRRRFSASSTTFSFGSLGSPIAGTPSPHPNHWKPNPWEKKESVVELLRLPGSNGEPSFEQHLLQGLDLDSEIPVRTVACLGSYCYSLTHRSSN